MTTRSRASSDASGRQRDASAASASACAEAERDEYYKLYRLLQEENEQLKRGLLGQKAERLPKNDAQITLAMLELALGGEAPGFDAPAFEIEQTIPEHEQRKPVRKPLPDHLPRVEIEILPDEVKQKGLDQFDRIGEETREVLERRPASMASCSSYARRVALTRENHRRCGRRQPTPRTSIKSDPSAGNIDRHGSAAG